MKYLISILLVILLSTTATIGAQDYNFVNLNVSEFEKEAQGGDEFYQFKLGWCYYYGLGGVRKNYAKAIEWLGRSAEQGNPYAKVFLGKCYFSGDVNVAADSLKARAYFTEALPTIHRKANDGGAAMAQLLMGDYSRYGYLDAPNINEAEKWYKKAAGQGNAEALNSYGEIEISYVSGRDDLERAARQGCAHAAFNLGYYHFTHLKYEKEESYRAAAAYMSIAAKQGLDKAQYYLGMMYKDGKGVEKNQDKAKYYIVEASKAGYFDAIKELRAIAAFNKLLKAANNGDLDAIVSLGNAYYNGEGVGQDYNTAAKLYSQAIEQESGEALYRLGMCYLGGTGVSHDFDTALDCLNKATKKDHAGAMAQLGYLLYEERASIKGRDKYDAAWPYLWTSFQNHRALIDGGKREYYLGLIKKILVHRESNEKDEKIRVGLSDVRGFFYQAVKCGYKGAREELEKVDKEIEFFDIKKKAEQGDTAAQYQLGQHYYDGEGVKKDYSEAAKWYRKAAIQGNTDAQYALGECFENGEGVSKDLDEAMVWILKAANQGHAKAQNSVGLIYGRGEGVTKNHKIAVEWYRKAAEQGYPAAQRNLGLSYKLGEGVEKNIKVAKEWFKKAMDNGDEDAKKLYEEMVNLEQGLQLAKKYNLNGSKWTMSFNSVKSTLVLLANGTYTVRFTYDIIDVEYTGKSWVVMSENTIRFGNWTSMKYLGNNAQLQQLKRKFGSDITMSAVLTYLDRELSDDFIGIISGERSLTDNATRISTRVGSYSRVSAGASSKAKKTTGTSNTSRRRSPNQL